jgi:Flp pilus assembly protein TadG
MFVRHSRTRRRQGTTAIQFALVFPLFFTFVLGFIEFGRANMVASLLNNAARNGCRVAVLTGKTNTDVDNAITTSLTSTGIRSYTTTVKVNNAVANASTAKSDDEITVSISVPVRNISWIPGTGLLTGNLTGKCTLYKE